jgi:FkbM family methyltransferase
MLSPEPEPEPEPEPAAPAAALPAAAAAPAASKERPSAADVLEKLFGSAAVADFFFVQVGANVGDTPQDPLYRSIQKYGWHGLLVEPLTHAMAQLRTNYAGCEGLLFEQCAISDAEGDRTLHFPDEGDSAFLELDEGMQTIAKGTASFNSDHTNKVCKVQGHNIAMSHEVCRCDTMARVLQSRQVAPEAVRLLVVDTEGHDHVILNSLDYSVSSPTHSLPPTRSPHTNLIPATLQPSYVASPRRCFCSCAHRPGRPRLKGSPLHVRSALCALRPALCALSYVLCGLGAGVSTGGDPIRAPSR